MAIRALYNTSLYSQTIGYLQYKNGLTLAIEFWSLTLMKSYPVPDA